MQIAHHPLTQKTLAPEGEFSTCIGTLGQVLTIFSLPKLAQPHQQLLEWTRSQPSRELMAVTESRVLGQLGVSHEKQLRLAWHFWVAGPANFVSHEK